ARADAPPLSMSCQLAEAAAQELYSLSLHDALPICDGSFSSPQFRVAATLHGELLPENSSNEFPERDDAAPREGRGVISLRKFIRDRRSTRLNSSHVETSYAVFCVKTKTLSRSATEL